MNELKVFAQKVPDKFADFVKDRPLWQKVTLGSTVVGYLYIRYKWLALNNCGVDVVPPSILEFGTTKQYFYGEGVKDFAVEELVKKKRRTIAFYRLTTPIYMTIDPELIKAVFTTHFGSFPHRNPAGKGSIGAGPIFGNTLDITADMPKWKRLRSTLAAGFSTRQLNEMIPSIDEAITKFALSLKETKSKPIDGRTVASKFAVDTFTAATFSTNVTNNGSIEDFAKAPMVEAVLSIMNPTAKILIPLIVPYGGDMMDAIGWNVMDTKSIKFFESFCRSLLSQRQNQQGGRTKDFLNLMIANEITDPAGKTKGMTMDEIIGAIFVFFVAGYETTSSTIASALFILNSNRKYMDKIKEEADRASITDTNSVSEENLPWTCAVISEKVMRIASPIAMHVRVADFGGAYSELPLNGVKFLDGCNLEVPIDVLHTHEEFWERPNDFYPERFIENPDLTKEWFYMPFGGGPRNCVGMRLALLEIRLGLLRIIQNFDVRLDDGSKDVKLTRNSFQFSAFEPKNPEFIFTPRQ